MRIACPVSTDEGVGSRMHEHFGSAPGFVVIDSVSMETTYIPNPNREHGHGMCSPSAPSPGTLQTQSRLSASVPGLSGSWRPRG